MDQTREIQLKNLKEKRQRILDQIELMQKKVEILDLQIKIQEGDLHEE